MGRKVLLSAAVVLAILAGARCNDSNTVTNPGPVANPTATPRPGAPTATPMPGNPTATPTPPSGNPTPTATPQPQAATVDVGANGGNTFVDRASGSSTTTIRAGSIVHWIWQSSFHSTTSGTCSGTCTPDGQWDSGVGSGMCMRST